MVHNLEQSEKTISKGIVYVTSHHKDKLFVLVVSIITKVSAYYYLFIVIVAKRAK